MDSEFILKVSNLIGTNDKLKDVTKLHGDASYRTYYRATTASNNSFIVMQMPEGKQSVSEEITNFNGTHKELPFLNVSRFLDSKGLPVPKIIRDDLENHLLILEDLGDQLLANLVDNQPQQTQRQWYKKAIDLLLTMQQKTQLDEPEKCVAFKRSFDETLFNWEFNHFLEYGIEARTGIKLSDTDQSVFHSETHTISKEIRNYPYCFTHRDFQSRNLLVKNESLYMIDFQDALMGPCVYDLVSLLRDSYVKLPTELVMELVKYYSTQKRLDYNEIQMQFDLVTIQRKLKDAGRFVFIDRVKKNPKFLENIPTSLSYVKEAFSRVTKYSRLYGLLKKYIPEWRNAA